MRFQIWSGTESARARRMMPSKKTAAAIVLSKSGTDGTQFVLIEMRDNAGALIDNDFLFITLERS
jgi:hypothetical protein